MIVHWKQPPDVWYLYKLVDPRNNWTFYIGITTNPIGRAKAHQTSTESAANSRIYEMAASGIEAIMKVIAEFPNQARAAHVEKILIKSLPHLVNRAGRPEAAALRKAAKVARIEEIAAWMERHRQQKLEDTERQIDEAQPFLAFQPH